MLRPVGRLSPSTYWRRRLLFAVVAVVLLAITAYVLWHRGGASPSAAPPTSSTPAPRPSPSPSPATASTAPSSVVPPSSASAGLCDVSGLAIAAVASATYQVTEQPTLYLQVTNPGTAPCVQDLSDKVIELRVYNGASRVWGSHDCRITQEPNVRTLAAGMQVKIGIEWSGLTSRPGCAGVRQRVGVGTYTLYALLAGIQGKAANFSITGS